VGEYEKFYLFNKVTIKPPTASAEAATEVGQLSATLNATVGTHGHAALECAFEYTTAADITFASATDLPCFENPDGYTDTALEDSLSELSPATSYRYL